MRGLFADLASSPIGVAESVAAGPSTATTGRDGKARDFVIGRWLARRSLAELGIPPSPIPRGDQGMPVWPAGVLGSITHCPGYAGAVVARVDDLRSLGIDTEPDLPVSRRLCARIALPSERQWIGTDLRRARILFSVKESVYKAWFPVAKRWLGFRDVLVTFTGPTSFEITLLVPAPWDVTALPGRYSRQDGLIRTAVVVPRH